MYKPVSHLVRADLAVLMDLERIAGKPKPTGNSEITLGLECDFECGCLMFSM